MDTISPTHRSENMRHIRSAGTTPELAVRKMVHAMGYRYRLHTKELPGKPDLVFPSRHKVVFVHGCFWHQHPSLACRIVRTPKSNEVYWLSKLARNRERDIGHIAKLKELGWQAKIVWECEVRKDLVAVGESIRGFLG